VIKGRYVDAFDENALLPDGSGGHKADHRKRRIADAVQISPER
jgi:hypothetical protein